MTVRWGSKMSNEKVLHYLKKTIASTNINFLIGSGLSSPFLEILKDIEINLTKAEDKNDTDEITKFKNEYFTKCIEGNLEIVDESTNAGKDDTLNSYKSFFRSINYLLLKREDSILTKQVNVFTTNVDIFSEKALEEASIEFNDGFSGRFKPLYGIGNFNKSYFKKSLHYENTTEIPVFNILKLHGSLTWEKEGEAIILDRGLQVVRDVKKDFDNYDKLMIVNPTQKKFEDTVLNEYYYNLIRVYSNELEKENSVLFVMGFSFSDLHLQNLTMQVANSNPTLMVYVFCYNSMPNTIYESMKSNAKNKNIDVLYPEEGEKYNLPAVTKNYFEKISLDYEDVDGEHLDEEISDDKGGV